MIREKLHSPAFSNYEILVKKCLCVEKLETLEIF